MELWHTQRLTAEFEAGDVDTVKTFDDYRQLEDRLFTQLEDKVVARVPTGVGYELFRYSSGSTSDPQIRDPNWNRSFELPADEPAGGVLLLHGMSDSPYSLRALGQALNARRFWVLGPRLPGHGTAPSGFRHIDWEDMAAVVRLGVQHLAARVGEKPIHIVGYSMGAPLALDFALDALAGRAAPLPASLVLISPAIGVHPLAGLAGLKNGLSGIPGLGRLAWLSIEPEFDPYKYNSFTTNAGNQVHRLTRDVSRRIAAGTRSDAWKTFPPVLVFKSTVDATVSTTAVIDRLLTPLGSHGHELVLFDINRLAAQKPLLVSDPGPLSAQLMADDTLPFTMTLITNERPDSARVHALHKTPFTADAAADTSLDLAWPMGVISLSHVALPFPPDDPLYGQQRPENSNAVFLGQFAIRGERGLFKLSSDWLLRLRYNPFYDYLEKQVLMWVAAEG
jgi:alpha-beta hydrolase superfamily lysophospholipase